MGVVAYLASVFGDSPQQPAPKASGLGGYTGAGYSDRIIRWQPGVGSADADHIRDLRELRARSRDLVRNTPIGAGAIDTTVTHVIGSGLRLQARIDAKRLAMSPEAAAAWQSDTEWRWFAWASSTYCDAGDEMTFADLQDLALRTTLESGDAFPLLTERQRPGWPQRLALQIIEADRISNPSFAADRPGQTAGIERDDAGAAVAAHICSQHPGQYVANRAPTWRRVTFRGASGRRNLLHLKRIRRPGQTRGIPMLAPIIGTLKQMDRYSQAEIDAAVNSAASAVFAKMDAEAFADMYDDASKSAIVDRAMSWDGGMQSGRVINLLPGEDVTSPTPGRPNPNFDPFMSAFFGLVGVGLGIPKEVVAKHFQSSYSAARAALMDAWRTFTVWRVWFVAHFCQPVYEEWLADEVAAGRIAAPGFFADPLIRAAWSAATWSGDGPGAIDPLKEANAIEKRVEIGLTTLADETSAYDGGDWETRHAQRVTEVAARRAGGLEPGMGLPDPPDREDPEDDPAAG